VRRADAKPPADGLGLRAARVGIAIAVVLLAFAVVRVWDFTIPRVGAYHYQAVFLANGQTWFGHYRHRIGPYAAMDSVYYVQTNAAQDTDVPPTSQLIKRGNELQAPEADVLIPKTAILFIEDLRDDSPIAKYMDQQRWLAGWVRWLALPALRGALAGAAIDPGHLPFVAGERIDAVLVLDGQAYFGHLEDFGLSDSVTLRDVYYFQDAQASTTNLPVGLVQRGTELHAPADGMRIRRDKILAIEHVGAGSPVARAIATEREIERLAR
jgi:hypothetical protein